MRGLIPALLLAWAGGALGESSTAAADAARAAALAAPCAGCHRDDARDTGGIPGLSGLSAREIRDRLMDYRSGERSGTLMNRLARGYSAAEIELLANALGRAPETGARSR